MSQRIPWLRVLVEGVAIVMSILLAFALQAWGEGRQEREEERGYLESLQTDFQRSHALALEHISRNEETILSASRLLRTLSEPPGSVHADTLAELLDRSFWIWTFEPVLATYQDMVNSGDLRLLRSEELRIALSQFEERVATVDRREEIVWEHWLRFDLPFLKDHGVLSSIYEGYRGSADRNGVEVEALSFGETSFVPDGDALRSRTFQNIVIARTVAHQDVVVNMKVGQSQIESILDLVEAELGQFRE